MSAAIQTFETIMIFKDALTEEEYLNKVMSMKKQLAELPATKIKTEQRGMKKLAYEARGCSYGWFVYFIYQSTEGLIRAKLDPILRKDDDVIKYLTTSFDKDYTPDSDDAPVNRKKPVDVFDLIFNIN